MLLLTPSHHLLGGLFNSFSRAGCNIGIGVAFDGEVTFNIHYAMNFQNAHDYRANIGFKLMKILHEKGYKANVYASCRHGDGLSSLNDLLSLVDITDARDAKKLEGHTSSFNSDEKRRHFSVSEFLLRVFFSLGKSVSLNITDQSTQWSLRHGGELLTDLMSASDMQDVQDKIMTSLSDTHMQKKGDIKFDKDLLNTLASNHALHAHVLGMGALAFILSGQRENLQRQWTKIKQAAKDGRNDARRTK